MKQPTRVSQRLIKFAWQGRSVNGWFIHRCKEVTKLVLGGY